MENTVIKNAGNSRSLHFPVTAVTEYQNLAAFLAAGISEAGIPIDIGPLNPEGVVQMGTPLNKHTLLKDETAALYAELPEDPTVDDVFALISDMIYRATTGKAKVVVTVELADGTPVPDACIGALTTQAGGDVFTGSDGKAIGYVTAGSRSISVSNMLDITSNTQTVSASAGGSYTVDLIAQTRNFMEYTSSQSKVYISGLAKRVDVSVGGGGGGSASFGNNYSQGSGGGGGYTSIKENVAFNARTPYTLSIGSGGSAGNTSVNDLNKGNNGGQSSFLSVSASGGGGGGKGGSSSPERGIGNGNGGDGYRNNAGAGTQYIYSSYTGQALYGGGGGGGINSSPYNVGGKPGGGTGGYSTTITPGTSGLGGGAGGAYSGGSGQARGATGGSGKVAVRIHF